MSKPVRKTSSAAKTPIRDLAGPAYRRFERMIMRPDDSLFVAGVIVGGALFAWLITLL